MHHMISKYVNPAVQNSNADFYHKNSGENSPPFVSFRLITISSDSTRRSPQK